MLFIKAESQIPQNGSSVVVVKATTTKLITKTPLIHNVTESAYVDLYLYITWQYALLCYRATGVT